MLIVNEHTREIEIIVYNDEYDREQNEKKNFSRCHVTTNQSSYS
jgi:hypothetical protein